MKMSDEIEILAELVQSVKSAVNPEEKLAILRAHLRLEKRGLEPVLEQFSLKKMSVSSKIAFYSILLLDQQNVVFSAPATPQKIESFLTLLESVEHFYTSIGGVLGYHLKVLQLLAQKKEPFKRVSFTKAPLIDLTMLSTRAAEATLEGIRALPELAEIYPIGGLGSRLGLHSNTGEPLPAAALPFAGRSLLEGLVRDVQAREFLYFRLFNKHVTIPIALMTSLENNNAERVRAICKQQSWFSRPKASFFLFSQLSVPVISTAGRWVMRAPQEPKLQPGGHGALWRTAEERGVFSWLQKQQKHRVLVRQINNPIGGTDFGLLALVGIGKQEKKAFGFASCERLEGAAEGALVQKEGSISNIEYTEFKELEIEPHDLPANTNILYADLHKLHPVIRKNPLPGLMVNMKNRIHCHTAQKEVLGGRLESMMQNISEVVPTFLTYNARRRTLSAAKRSFEKGGELIETPEGAFYDLLYNGHELLEKCGVSIEDFCSQKEYLEKGPSHLFLYHPALGPLYELIGQKIRLGRFKTGSELQLEIADLYLEKLDLEGSLLIHANQIVGHLEKGENRYSQKTGKCVLKQVRVQNGGIKKEKKHCFWKNQIERHEALTLVLEGRSEFYAEGITFSGNQTIVVPDKERWIAQQDAEGRITYLKQRADWEWTYEVVGNCVRSKTHFS